MLEGGGIKEIKEKGASAACNSSHPAKCGLFTVYNNIREGEGEGGEGRRDFTFHK